MTSSQINAIAEKIRAGDRRQLAKSITCAESTREADRKLTNALLDTLLPSTGNAMRIGISGTPGVGKSTFIETLGQQLCDQEKRVAVLSVDPSSSVNGGSILGDKTRMPGLSSNPNAYIRPSPSGNTLGGVSENTNEAILLCEAAGFDVIFVETVGVGQSEITVSQMTDLFLLLLLPAGGDELQGIKRGVVELADFILINKADGELVDAATRTVGDYRAALQLLQHDEKEQVGVFSISALTDAGVKESWLSVESRWRARYENGDLERKREGQRLTTMHNTLSNALYARIRKQFADKLRLSETESAVSAARLSAGSAVDRIIRALDNAKQHD